MKEELEKLPNIYRLEGADLDKAIEKFTFMSNPENMRRAAILTMERAVKADPRVAAAKKALAAFDSKDEVVSFLMDALTSVYPEIPTAYTREQLAVLLSRRSDRPVLTLHSVETDWAGEASENHHILSVPAKADDLAKHIKRARLAGRDEIADLAERTAELLDRASELVDDLQEGGEAKEI